VPDFFLVKYIKGGKNALNDYKITKCPLNIPDDHKIIQMKRIYKTTFSTPEVLQNIPKLVFLD
jgi:hypothetical protein